MGLFGAMIRILSKDDHLDLVNRCETRPGKDIFGWIRQSFSCQTPILMLTGRIDGLPTS
jgi:hypothetical protein